MWATKFDTSVLQYSFALVCVDESCLGEFGRTEEDTTEGKYWTSGGIDGDGIRASMEWEEQCRDHWKPGIQVLRRGGSGGIYLVTGKGLANLI